MTIQDVEMRILAEFAKNKIGLNEISSVPGRIVTFSIRNALLGIWKRDLTI